MYQATHTGFPEKARAEADALPFPTHPEGPVRMQTAIALQPSLSRNAWITAEIFLPSLQVRHTISQSQASCEMLAGPARWQKDEAGSATDQAGRIVPQTAVERSRRISSTLAKYRIAIAEIRHRQQDRNVPKVRM
jgi:hypothetical protein